MHTVRPVKRVDAAGSLRLSADYVGSMRSPPSSDAAPLTAEDKDQKGSGKLRKRSKTELENAGRSLVDQVVLPTLQRVRLGVVPAISTADTGNNRRYAMIWTLER